MTFATRPFGSSFSINRAAMSEEGVSPQERRLITMEEQLIEGNTILSAFHLFLTRQHRQSLEINPEVVAKMRNLIVLQRNSLQESRGILSTLTPSGKENRPAHPLLIVTLLESLNTARREFSTLDRTLTPLIQ